jgi:hypothetical protein
MVRLPSPLLCFFCLHGALRVIPAAHDRRAVVRCPAPGKFSQKGIPLSFNSGLEKFRKRCRRPTRDQLDGVKFQGSRSSILLAGWPAAIASRVAFR